MPSETSVDEPGGGNSEKYRLSHRLCHLLPELNPLKSALASGKRCYICNYTMSYFRSTFQVREQIISPTLQTARSSVMASMHTGANVEVAHQFLVSLKQGGLLLLQKCQFRLAWEIFFMGETPKAEQRLPTSRAKPCPIHLQG